jgi:hypothetical protein
VGSTTNVQVLFFVQWVWTSQKLSELHDLHAMPYNIFNSIKEKLRSGEMAMSGDQWPIFVYHGYDYDPDDPWNSLFWSTLLVSVSLISLCFNEWYTHNFRHTNISLHLLVQLKSNQKPRALEMLVFIV